MIGSILCFFGLHHWSRAQYAESILDRKGRRFWAHRYDPTMCRRCGLHK